MLMQFPNVQTKVARMQDGRSQEIERDVRGCIMSGYNGYNTSTYNCETPLQGAHQVPHHHVTGASASSTC